MGKFYKASRLLPAILLMAVAAACGTVGGSSDAELPLSDERLPGKFVWHDLLTDDVAGARRFYAGLLGWEFEDTVRPNGGPYTLIKSDGYYVGGMLEVRDPGNGEDYSRWLGYLSVADVRAAAEATRQAGGEVIAAPREIGEFATAAAIADPQGAVVGLIHSHAGDPVDGFGNRPGHVVWDELLTADYQAAAGFYSSLTGLDSEAVARRGGEYILLQKGGVERAGIMQRPAADIQPLWLTYIAVTSPEAAADKVIALGGEVLLAPSADLREGSMALVTDPGGAVLALQRWPE